MNTESFNFSPRALKAKELFEKGYNCAQATLLAFDDLTELPEDLAARLASPFGGGMARMREVCGAISGAFMAYGAIYGKNDPKDATSKAQQYKELQTIANEFREINGSIVCRDLLGLTEKVSEPAPEKRTSEYYQKRPCGMLVAIATQILENFIENKKKSLS